MSASIIKTSLFATTLFIAITSALAAEPTSFRDCPDCPEMISLPAGQFTMGLATANKPGDEAALPAHTVQMKSFAIGKFEVTQDEWFAVMGTRPAHFKIQSNK
jgi:formylglycine-generating enzyme required for sulfatase activity